MTGFQRRWSWQRREESQAKGIYGEAVENLFRVFTVATVSSWDE
jgi:hypothetical protein